MSTCVSSHGEYSSHVPDDDFNCTRCWALDEDGLRAEAQRLRADLDEWASTADYFRHQAHRVIAENVKLRAENRELTYENTRLRGIAADATPLAPRSQP